MSTKLEHYDCEQQREGLATTTQSLACGIAMERLGAQLHVWACNQHTQLAQ